MYFNNTNYEENHSRVKSNILRLTSSVLNAILDDCFLILNTRFRKIRQVQDTVNLFLNGTESNF